MSNSSSSAKGQASEHASDGSHSENAAVESMSHEQQPRPGDTKVRHEPLDSFRAELRRAQQIETLNQDLTVRNTALAVVNRELEAFSYAVSHDLRNPLRSIHGFGEALAKSAAAKLTPEENDWLRRICDAAGRMDQLIDDLLKLSRITRGELKCQRVDLTALAWEIARQLTEVDPARRISWEIQPNLEAFGDPVLIRVAIENLLNNAWKYTGTRAAAVIAFRRELRLGTTFLCVRDNGVGFDMAYAGKLFAPFQKLHSVRQFPGSGVGLACVARVLHRHGGSIFAEAKVDEGAAFYFTLPEHDSDSDVPAREESERKDSKNPILLVEDTPDDADLTVLALKETGLLNEIVVAEDGVDALDYLCGAGRFAGRDVAVAPALILLDLRMPRMDGIEFLQRLRADERTKLLPVVILTTSNDDVDLVRAYECGANAFVRKPVRLAAFVQEVRKLGIFWVLLNERPRRTREQL